MGNKQEVVLETYKVPDFQLKSELEIPYTERTSFAMLDPNEIDTKLPMMTILQLDANCDIDDYFALTYSHL